MLSSKEKRFSHALPLSSSHEVNYPMSQDAPLSEYELDYGDELTALPTAPSNHEWSSKHWQSRFSNSLRTSLHQDLIMNRAMKNNTFADKRNATQCANNLPVQNFESMSQHRKETQEMKKQMFHMEKSLKYWSECTEYWRSKWFKTKEEKKQQQNELKQLRWKLSKLEQQLQVSERKNAKLTEEVVTTNHELSKYVQRLGHDRKPLHKTASLQVPHRNRIARESVHHKLNNGLDELDDKVLLRRSNSSTNPDPMQAFNSSSSSRSNLVVRQHERLFDKKIMNKKRFSQVVMVDEDEIMQLNEEIPIKESVDHNGLNHIESEQLSYQQHLEHLSEESNDEEDDGDKTNDTDCEGENSSEIDNLKLMKANHLDSSNISTMATNSECANVGSTGQYGSDSDSRGVDTPSKTTRLANARLGRYDLVDTNRNHIEDYEDGEI